MQDLKAIRFITGTKVSHDYDGEKVNTFSYRELCELKSPAIGIPCRQNKIIIIDVDVEGESHKNDGREFWQSFSEENGMPKTYTVRTPSGGYHYYFRLPESINPDTFSPPGQLAAGVDVKWNGWAGAPPSPGYTIEWGNLQCIQIAPPSLLMYMSGLIKGKPVATVEGGNTLTLETHRPFSPQQIKDLRVKIEWLQTNGSLSRQEWRDGIFALKAGIDDDAVLDELLEKWSMNRGYVTGDEDVAKSMAAKADKHGPIGPGSIFAILKNVAIREGAPAVDTPWTTQEIFDRSKVAMTYAKDGSIKVEVSESNAAALLGATFDEKDLYHDVRTDLYIYKGKSCSDSELVNMFMPMIQSPVYGLGLEKFRKAAVSAGLDILMAARRKDPHQEYLKSLRWDGIPRVSTFFQNYVGVTPSEYHTIVSKNFWVSLAARGLNPGCKFDSMVVIEGHEGIYKSSLVEAIGGEYTFAPSRKDALDNLDELRKMHQSVIVELPELMGLVNESSEKVKAFLAKPSDHIRALFAKKAMRNLRGFVFVGTTNSSKYLSAAMGVRRFWPIQIPKNVRAIDIRGIRADRDQLFAEAIQMYRDGYEYWDMPAELLDIIVESKVIEEPLMSPIKDMAASLGTKWSTMDVYKRLEAGGFVAKGYNAPLVARIESALMRLGNQKAYDPSHGGVVWQAKEKVMGLDSLI